MPIEPRVAVAVFAASWLLAQLLAALALALLGDGGAPSDSSIGVLAVSLIAAWSAYLGGMWYASQSAGSGDPVADYGISFAPVDLVGIAIGALCQLVLVSLVYLPLEALWPGTFTEDRLQENARDLVDRASGGSVVLLVVLVVVGAPIVEELFYRGLLQRSLVAQFSDALVVVGVAAVFALVHFRPVEYPGLFVFGLVLGVCAVLTDRLGLPIITHMSFNVTGLVLAW